jgi:antitoxin PrlF
MRITSKGQVTVPKRVRTMLGLSPGVEVRFVQKGKRVVLEKMVRRGTLKGAYGVLKSRTRTDHLINLLRGKKR